MEITLLSIVVRVSIMYLVALILLRLSGKQAISELATMDFVVITLLGDAFDSVIFSEATILEGIVYFSVVVLWHMLVRLAASHSELLYRLTSSPPRIMIQNGALIWENLRAEQTRWETMVSDLRQKGDDRLEEVKEAWMEEHGWLSVLRKDPYKPVRKIDLKSDGHR